jgi:hypothetical protein
MAISFKDKVAIVMGRSVGEAGATIKKCGQVR